ncbi:hypothetical protein SAMD00019534_043190 [Acytostelium subglobosum LB1]|uniref:hypothetical protein n=1 Tax=Acytostelium subglobosum LB1 TaxID=1410327 RepID=UPI0006447BEF|nr:hypothetical protein SAMD00019534_043190 [Acytostelium subglobosum LB1]GAM21144.1 hypothetical protein SAMD00019534_043190 [Acytostelium subglobosum LB1]|eukprot:XP_012756278.1 hypothetical protein SAMD00019534_043190 [Acytostelium subglobosum LB1]
MVAATSAFPDASGIVVVEVGNDTIRTYETVEGINSFIATGTAVYGSLTNTSLNAIADSNIFTFSGQNTCQYSLSYNHLAASIGGGVINFNATSFDAVYMPSLLVEYVETNGQDGFQNGSDSLVGWVRLDKLVDTNNPNWKINTSASEPLSTQANGEKFPFDVTFAEAISPRGLITFHFAIPGAPVIFNNVPLTAEQSKIDILINGYYDEDVNKASAGCTAASLPYSCASTGASRQPTSRLALVSYVATLQAQADLNIDGSTSLRSSGGEIDASLTWVDNVLINGTITAKVHTQVTDITAKPSKAFNNYSINIGFNAFASLNTQMLVQSFDAIRPNLVYWDPTFGGESAKASSGSYLLPSISLLLVTLFAIMF